MSITKRKQTHKYREQISGYQWRQGGGRDNKRVGDMKKKAKVLVAQLCLTLCDPMDFSPPGSSVGEILQSRILE